MPYLDACVYKEREQVGLSQEALSFIKNLKNS
jgi:hypothetical protein